MQQKNGTVPATGAAINVSLGFKPSSVQVIDDTTGNELLYFENMADGQAFKMVGIVDSGATGKSSRSKLAANGISYYAGDSTHAQGFTIGTDADVNVNGHTLRYIANGNGNQ